jgi:hypothetical protein
MKGMMKLCIECKMKPGYVPGRIPLKLATDICSTVTDLIIILAKGETINKKGKDENYQLFHGLNLLQDKNLSGK